MNHIFQQAPASSSKRTATAIQVAILLLATFLPNPSASADTSPHWQSPVGDPYSVERHFKKPPKKWNAGHRGVDFSATASTKVVAPEAGTISFSGKVVDRTVITITHPDGKKSSFEPVTNPLPIGTKVTKGQPIAAIDASQHHCPSLTLCVHWGVRKGDEYINPWLLIETQAPSILLPIDDDFSA
ncbi:M23 family metallopeptidase [Rothia terrae]|uniref:M23 family metallopeptidase n=1 Tax=Rothia terrae TaxID=396015 RepID=UPI001446CB80|nr:M23 family metallopeptidase [Rothia terrae]NKZ33839.1 M23 family metallopeptidase [Rothia terrae]